MGISVEGAVVGGLPEAMAMVTGEEAAAGATPSARALCEPCLELPISSLELPISSLELTSAEARDAHHDAHHGAHHDAFLDPSAVRVVWDADVLSPVNAFIVLAMRAPLNL